jgi:hypothetical protein
LANGWLGWGVGKPKTSLLQLERKKGIHQILTAIIKIIFKCDFIYVLILRPTALGPCVMA